MLHFLCLVSEKIIIDCLKNLKPGRLLSPVTLFFAWMQQIHQWTAARLMIAGAPKAARLQQAKPSPGPQRPLGERPEYQQ